MSQSAPLSIAILDRDSGFLTVLAKRLERLEWKHLVLTSPGPQAKIASLRLDALIVDLAILGPNRWDWLERFCREHQSVRTVVCADRSSPSERVRALQLGADDWLSKPCHPEELIARVEAVVRHQRPPRSSNLEPVTIGELEIRDQHQAFAAERRLNLTRREFQLLMLFADSRDVILERNLIYERVWGYECMRRDDRSIDVFVHKLRRKLEAASPQWRYIHTHCGVGYRFAAEPIESFDASVLELKPGRQPSTTLLAA